MKNIQIISNKLGTNNSSPVIIWIDRTILFCFSILVFILPIPHTITIRTFAFYIPITLFIVRSFLMRDFTWRKTSFELPFAVFFLVALTSLITAHNPQKSIEEIWKNLVIPILYFYTFYLSIKKEDNGLFLIMLILLGNFISNLYSFYGFKMNSGTLFAATYRAEGLKGATEINGLYQTMIFPFIFWGLFYFKKYWQKILLFILICTNLLALHITFTRAAYLALAMQLLFITGIFILKKRWISSLIITLFLILVSFFYIENKMFREMHTHNIPPLNAFIQAKPEDIAGASPGSMEQRLAMWKTAIELIAQKPFYAHGYGRFNFGEIVRNETNKNFILYPNMHSTFISVAFELGIQGLIIFLWMIGAFIIATWKVLRKNDSNLSFFFSASLLTMMAGYWVGNLFQNFDADDIKLLFMVMLGIGMAVMHRIPKEKELLHRRQ